MAPRDLGDGWTIASPASVGLATERLRAAYERIYAEDQFIGALSCLVICRGKLVAEGYVRDADDSSRKEHIQSCTKSLTCLAFGLARQDGYFPDLDEPLAGVLPIVDPAKSGITLRHLLTMRSGIGIDNAEFAKTVLMRKQRNVTGWILAQDLAFTPGAQFDYRDCDPQLVGAAILRRSGTPVDSIVTRRVFSSLGISDFHWEYDQDGEPLTAHGVWLKARDLAKLGELARTGGAWGNERVVPQDWIDLATRPQSEVPQTDAMVGFAYGFYYWIVLELRGYAMWGHGGNFVLVVPDAALVLVVTSLPDAGTGIASQLRDVTDLARLLLGR